MDHNTGYSIELQKKLRKYHFPESAYAPEDKLRDGFYRPHEIVDLAFTTFVFGDVAVKGEDLAKLLGMTDGQAPIGHVELATDGNSLIFVDDPAEQFAAKKSA